MALKRGHERSAGAMRLPDGKGYRVVPDMSVDTSDNGVELATTAGTIGIRDSKDQGGPVLEFSRHEVANLLDRARSGALRIIVSA